MSEEPIFSKKQLLFIVIVAVVIFLVGMILIFTSNIYFNELFYGNEIAYAIFSVITYLGEVLPQIIIIAVLWFIYDKRFAKNLALAVLGSDYLNNFTKEIFQDPRPWTNDIANAEGFGFPSGHAQIAVTTWGYIAYETRKNKILPWVFMIIIYLVAISRIIVGVHDIQDVVGGLLIGIIFIVIFIYLEPMVSKTINKFNFSLKIIIAIAVPILLFILAILVFPATEEAYGMDCGAMMGVSIGYLIESEKIQYDPRNIGIKQKVINVIIGLVLTLIVYVVLSLIPLEFIVWDFIRYFILAVILTTLAPWIFTKIQKKS